jgi:hypothetical protein
MILLLIIIYRLIRSSKNYNTMSRTLSKSFITADPENEQLK